MSMALSEFHIPHLPPGEDELPCDDGEPMETERHRRQMNVLADSLELGWHDRDDFYVGANMAVYFSELQAKNNDFRAPDLFVVLDTVRRERKSWVVWQEGGQRPDVVIELLSPITEHADRGEKKRIYAKILRVAQYYLFDPLEGHLEGYTLEQGEYRKIEPLPSGDLPCPRLGLRLGIRHGKVSGVEAGWLRWIDEDGHVLPLGEELATDEARLRAEAEREHAKEARLREEAERQRAAEARLRAEAERRLAEALAEIERLKRKGD